MREAPNCAKKCEERLVVRICAGDGKKCDFAPAALKRCLCRVHGTLYRYIAYMSNLNIFILKSVMCKISTKALLVKKSIK